MTTISPTSTGQTNQTPLAADSAKSAMITSDFNMFLNLLTAQIRNQDPLNPMESTEFATQLATFSGVEQQVRTNENLQLLSQQFGLASLAQLSSWIGMEVETSGPAWFGGAALTLLPDRNAQAEEADLIVTDATGRQVQRIAIDPAAAQISWAGIDSNGNSLPNGAYSFEVESFARGQSLGKTSAAHRAVVDEARANGTAAATLILGGGVAVEASTVRALRRPAGL